MPLLKHNVLPDFVRVWLRDRVDGGTTVQALAAELDLKEESLLRVLAGLACTKRTYDAAVGAWSNALTTDGVGEKSNAAFVGDPVPT